MPYIEISRDTLNGIAENVLELSASGSEANAFGQMLSALLKNDDIPAAKGLLVFAAETSLIPTSIANFQKGFFESEQCVIDLLAFYEYLPKFNFTNIPDCIWNKKHLQTMTVKMLEEHAKKSLSTSRVTSCVASLDVLRAFFAKKIQTRWIDYTLEPVLLKFIKCIDHNCLHVAKLNEKSEIKIRLGLLLFVLMHISNESDHLFVQCASFLKIKSYSEVVKKNQRDLLIKLRDFIDNTMSQLIDISAEEVFSFRGELVEYLSKIEGNHDKNYYEMESFIDPRDNFASFGEFAYQGIQVMTSLASNLSSFFSLQNEPGTTFGNTKLRGLKYSNKDDPEFFKRWLKALLSLPDNALSEQNKRVIRKIMRVEPEEKLEDDFIEVDPDQFPSYLRLGQA